MCVVREVSTLHHPWAFQENGNMDEVFKEDPLQEVIMRSTDDGSTDDGSTDDVSAI